MPHPLLGRRRRAPRRGADVTLERVAAAERSRYARTVPVAFTGDVVVRTGNAVGRRRASLAGGSDTCRRADRPAVTVVVVDSSTLDRLLSTN
jgi:hypothetical protein